MRVWPAVAVSAALLLMTAGAQQSDANAYDRARLDLKTTARNEKARQPYDVRTPPGVEAVRYKSADRDLLAWVARPANLAPGATAPVMVYAHGGFALGAGDYVDAHQFVRAGYIVMMPALRGENGNAGRLELFLGEVDDLMAAGEAARSLPGADGRRVYLFGHSIGGGLANLVALSDSNPYRLIASSGGNYTLDDCAEIAQDWGTFNRRRKSECLARFPDPYLATLGAPVFAYAGEADTYAVAIGRLLKSRANDNFNLVIMPGDHMSSVAPSIRDFIARIADG